MSVALEKRLDKLQQSIRQSLDDHGGAIESLSPTTALKVLSDSYRSTRVAGLPVDKRKDHLQVVYRLSDPSAVEIFTHPYKDVGCISIWRLLVAPYDLAHVIGVNFFYDLSKSMRAVGNGIISCEHPERVKEFLSELKSSPVHEVLTAATPEGASFMANIVGCRGDYISDPKYDVAVTLTCNDAQKHRAIVELFDVLVHDDCQDYLGVAHGKSMLERRDYWYEKLLEKRLSWTQEHKFEVVRAYAHLLKRIESADNKTTLYFVVDAYRNHFHRQISSMLRELGASKVVIEEHPHQAVPDNTDKKKAKIRTSSKKTSRKRNRPGNSSNHVAKATASITSLLKKHQVPLSAVKANRLLLAAGILEEKVRLSQSDRNKQKKYKVFTEEGLKYGRNVTSRHAPDQSSPEFYLDTFSELVRRFLSE